MSDYVVILHGITRSSKLMDKLARQVASHGHAVFNENYPSTSAPIKQLAEGLYLRIKPLCENLNKKLHFIAHSMGALITRYIIATYQPVNLGRVVFLAPPNQGSQLVDKLKWLWLFRKFCGPAGSEMGHGNDSFINSLPPKINFELGIIAGDRSIDPFYSWFLLSGKDDGKLTIEETKLDGMKEHIVIHANHTYMPQNQEAIDLTIRFIQHGSFSKD